MGRVTAMILGLVLFMGLFGLANTTFGQSGNKSVDPAIIEPEWYDFCAPKYCEAVYDDPGMFESQKEYLNNYWVKRRESFEKRRDLCRHANDVARCYINLEQWELSATENFNAQRELLKMQRQQSAAIDSIRNETRQSRWQNSDDDFPKRKRRFQCDQFGFNDIDCTEY